MQNKKTNYQLKEKKTNGSISSVAKWYGLGYWTD